MQFFIQSCLTSKWAKENVFYYCYIYIYKLPSSIYIYILKSGYKDSVLRLACIQLLVTIQQHADANIASNHLDQ